MAYTSTFNVEGFSISHAAILDGTDGSEEADGDVYGVRSGSLEVDMDEFDNTGDDAVLSRWQWFNYANVTIEMGYVPFKLIALLTGETVTTTSSGTNNESHELPIWTEAQNNQAYRPMRLRIPAKDDAGLVRILDIILYRCAFKPMSFDGPSYKDGLLLNYSATALPSTTDEANNAVPRGIGRILSLPSA